MTISRPFAIKAVCALVVLAIGIYGVANYHADIPADVIKKKYTDAESKFITVEGIEVHYKDEGVGLPVVLLHGMSSSLHTWDGWIKDLNEWYRVVRLDIPPFGVTGPNKTGDYSIDWYDKFLTAFLDALKIDKCFVAGNSFGGRLAWEYAVRHPERVRKMILIDAARYKRSLPAPVRLARVPVLSSVLTKITPRSIVSNAVVGNYGDRSKVSDALVQRYFDLTLRAGNRAGYGDWARALRHNETTSLSKLYIPVLIMWGAKDPWIPVEDAGRFKLELPDARVIVYPEAGHMPMEELPEKTAKDAYHFFRGSIQDPR